MADPTVQERNFPWFDNMDLNENLRKTLTIDKMVEYGANGTYLFSWIFDRINIAAMTDIALQIQSTDLYGRKKNLEERMIAYLETQ